MPVPRRSNFNTRSARARRQRTARATQTIEQRRVFNERTRIRNATVRRNNQSIERQNTYREAFQYDATINYSAYDCVTIGAMTYVCQHCNALKYRNEPPGSLLPSTNADYQYLQIYFMGNSPQEVDQRCVHNNTVKRALVQQLQTFLHEQNALVTLFKTALDRMPSENPQIVIRSDKTPVGQHSRRFNAPTIDDVAIVVVGEHLQSRDIVLQRRDDQLKRVYETHSSYDALQYPIMFWQGEDGYDFSIKMINPETGSFDLVSFN